jgi:DNA polymerase II large subunit
MLLMDGLLNFSRQFLPEKRGGRMDAPLVLTTILDPKEVDKEVHNMDVVSVYPLEFYESTLDFENPKNFDSVIERVENRLKSKKRFYGLSYTHETDDISSGPVESRYKSLGPMVEKMKSQLILAEKIRAVNEKDVAERVINTHFLPDLIGNLRAFSRQKFRCVDCNAKYRRIPLQGKCLKCGGNLTLTVHYGTITKYLEISKEVSEKYSVNDYTRQRINLIDLEIRSLFENEKSKQIRISDFF